MITSTLHEPRHAAPFDFHRDAAAIVLSQGYKPRHAHCHRCTPNATGPLCNGCAGEVARALRDPDDELVAVNYTAHSPALDTYRTDIRFGGVL